MPSVLGAGMQDVLILVSKGTAAPPDSRVANFACPVLLCRTRPGCLACVDSRPHDHDRQQSPSLPIFHRIRPNCPGGQLPRKEPAPRHVPADEADVRSQGRSGRQLQDGDDRVLLAGGGVPGGDAQHTALRLAGQVAHHHRHRQRENRPGHGHQVRRTAASCRGCWRTVSATPDCLEIVIVAGRSLDPLAQWAAEQSMLYYCSYIPARITGKARQKTSDGFTQCHGPLCGAKHKSS